MRATSALYKQIIASGNARDFVIKVDMTLADDPINPTVLHLTEEDIWSGSFAIDTASSGTSSFDIGTAVIGQCKFSLNNFDESFNQYDFFNAHAVVWVGLRGDLDNNDNQVYYRMGFFTVDEPTFASSLIQLVLLDNMWKFDVPFADVNITYPITALNMVLTICTYCGVSLATQTFHGYNFSITEAPENIGEMNCREVLQYVAMLGCNFCIIDDQGYLRLKWYDTSSVPDESDIDGGSFDTNTTPYSDGDSVDGGTFTDYTSGDSADGGTFTDNQSVAYFTRNFSTTFGTDVITITGVKFTINDTAYTIGTSGYVLELTNPFVNASNVNAVLNLIWDVLENFTLRTFNIKTVSDLAVEVGDCCAIKDYKGNYVYSWVTNNSFGCSNHLVQCNAVNPTRTLTKRYSKAVQAAVEIARQQTNEIISNFDLDVQLMNDLAINAMGGYEDYEDLTTGGRIWYWSNMPITKVNNVCSFETGSTVFKKSGAGFFVSSDGGTTWRNGYDAITGKLVINMLSAIGINFSWARGGTLTLGGYGNGNGELSIQNSSNVEKVHGDNTGLKVGANTGSKMHLTTDGELAYYYDNTYNGKLKMDSVNYGTEQSPDYEDTLSVEDFKNVDIKSEGSNARIRVRTTGDQDENGYVLLYADISDLSDAEPKGIVLSSKRIQLGIGSIGADNPLVTVGGDLDLDGKLITSGNYEGQNLGTYCLNNNGKITYHLFDKGVLVQETVGDLYAGWHSWSTGGVDYDTVSLAVGNTTATFPDVSDDYAYEPYIKCAKGVSPPQITDIKITANDECVVTFTAVTSAQTGSGQTSECEIKLWAILELLL